MRGGSKVRRTAATLAFGGLLASRGLSRFTRGDEFFLDEFNYRQLDRENLLKGPDDLTSAYWTDGASLTTTDEGNGVFRMTKGAAAHQRLTQDMTDWFPKWAGEVSLIFEIRAGTLSNCNVSLYHSSAHQTMTGEKISGAGTFTIGGIYAEITGLDSNWSKFRVSASAKAWATSFETRLYPGGANADAGHLDVRLVQIILGDQPDEKPRPINQETDHPMLAYRPDGRLTRDGSARALVVDTEGLLWCGEATDIKVAPTTGTAITASANPRLTGRVTVEDTKYVDVMIRYTDANNWVKLRIHTDRQVQLIKNVAGTPTTVDTGSTLTDAELYRYEFVADGSSVKAYIDDKLEVEGTITDHQTVAQARVEHDLASNDLRVVAETNPKGIGRITAGGRATPASGDPGMWHTKPDGSAFSVSAASAMLVTVTPFIVETCDFGFDSNTAGPPDAPRGRFKTGKWWIDNSEYGDIDVADVSAGVEYSFMHLLRSDTHGHHFLQHTSGKQWKLLHTDRQAIAASSYPAVSNYTGAHAASRIALLNLSSWVGGDFAEVLAEAANPINGGETAVWGDRDGGYSAEWDMVRGAALDSNRVYFNAADTSSRFSVGAGGSPTLTVYDHTIIQTVLTISGVVPANATHKIKITVAPDGTTRVFVGNVLEGSVVLGACKLAAMNEFVYAGTEDLNNFILNPFPALGLAASRIIAPQDGDTADCPSDSAVYVRNLTLASSGSGVYLDRRYKDSNNSHFMQLASDGECYDYKIVEGASTEMWAMAIGVVQDGDTILATLDGVKSEGFLNGASEGSSVLAGHLNETGAVFSNDRDFVCDSLEFWPLYHNLPFRL